jgi:hypothetical protein
MPRPAPVTIAIRPSHNLAICSPSLHANGRALYDPP